MRETNILKYWAHKYCKYTGKAFVAILQRTNINLVIITAAHAISFELIS